MRRTIVARKIIAQPFIEIARHSKELSNWTFNNPTTNRTEPTLSNIAKMPYASSTSLQDQQSDGLHQISWQPSKTTPLASQLMKPHQTRSSVQAMEALTWQLFQIEAHQRVEPIVGLSHFAQHIDLGPQEVLDSILDGNPAKRHLAAVFEYVPNLVVRVLHRQNRKPLCVAKRQTDLERIRWHRRRRNHATQQLVAEKGRKVLRSRVQGGNTAFQPANWRPLNVHWSAALHYEAESLLVTQIVPLSVVVQ